MRNQREEQMAEQSLLCYLRWAPVSIGCLDIHMSHSSLVYLGRRRDRGLATQVRFLAARRSFSDDTCGPILRVVCESLYGSCLESKNLGAGFNFLKLTSFKGVRMGYETGLP